jgi:hypothetical protein
VASKNAPKGQAVKKDAIHIKWVRRAGSFCKTTIKDGKQTQEWSTNRDEL